VSAPGSIRAVRGDLPEETTAAFVSSSRIAWDVETTGLDWRHDRLAMCQLFADEAGTTILMVGDQKPLRLVDLL
jgi:ribonuclease D